MATAVDTGLQAGTGRRRPRLPSVALLREAAASVIPAALLAAYALIPQPPYGAQPFHDAWRRHLLAAITLLIWTGLLLLRRRLPRSNPLALPLLVLFGVELLAVAAAPDWRIGVEPALDLLAAVLIFNALVDCPGLTATALRRALMLAALVVAVACLYFVWGRWLDWRALTQAVPDAGGPLLPPTVPRVLAVGTNPNIVAPLMTLTAPLYMLSILRLGGWRRVGVLAAALVAQLGIFFTLSRSAWAGEAAGLAVAAVLLFVTERRLRLPARGLAIITGVLGLILISLTALVLALGWRPLWLFRPSFTARSDFRGAAIEMIRAHPLLGTGPGSFSVLYPYVSNGDPAGAVHSHNILLQVGVDTGLIGLAATAAVAIAGIALLWQIWRDGDAAQRALVACLAGGWVSFAVGGMGDSLHLFPEILFVLGALSAIAIRAARQPGSGAAPDRRPFRSSPLFVRARRTSRLLGCVSLALAMLLMAAWLRMDQASREYARSIDLASRQRWSDAVTMAERASAIDPAMPVYYVQTGLSLAIEAETLAPGDLQTQARSGNAATAAELRERAIAKLQRALALEPRSAAARFDLAVLLYRGGREADALALLPTVVAGAPRDSLTLLGAGVLEESTQPERAIEHYAAALAESPRIADSPFWQGSSFRSAHFSEIVQRALDRAATEDSVAGPTATAEIIREAAGLSGDPPAVVSADGFVAQVLRGRRLTAAGEYAQAGSILRRAVDERPDDPSARLALGELEAATGNTAAARRQWVAGAYLGDVASIIHLGDTSPGGRVPRVIDGLGHWALTDLWVRQLGITQQHYRFAYRQQEPWPIILPGDWLNGLPRIYTQAKEAVERWDAAAPHPPPLSDTERRDQQAGQG